MAPEMSSSFGPLKQIEAGVLSVGYAEAGPDDGPAVVLLHGWPYDIHSFVEVTPLLAAAGYRVIVPYLRGYGSTRFLSEATPRKGQQSALAVDTIALMDALGIQTRRSCRLRLGRADGQHRRGPVARALQGPGVGQRLPDRQPASRPGAAAAGSRAALVVPVLLRYRARPGRLRQEPSRLRQAHLAHRLTEVELRRRHVRPDRRGLRQPRSRRHRDPQLPLAARPGRRRGAIRRPGTPAGRSPVIAVPTITLEGDANGAPHPGPAAYAEKFPGKYAHRTITGGIGHNLPQEAPHEFARAVIDASHH